MHDGVLNMENKLYNVFVLKWKLMPQTSMHKLHVDLKDQSSVHAFLEMWRFQASNINWYLHFKCWISCSFPPEIRKKKKLVKKIVFLHSSNTSVTNTNYCITAIIIFCVYMYHNWFSMYGVASFRWSLNLYLNIFDFLLALVIWELFGKAQLFAQSEYCDL